MHRLWQNSSVRGTHYRKDDETGAATQTSSGKPLKKNQKNLSAALNSFPPPPSFFLQLPLLLFQVGAFIVSPTRELARQIHAVAQPFVASLSWMQSVLLVGGTDPSADVSALKSHGGHLLIGTPGRLDDVVQRCSFLDLKTVEVLVLDEADRLLDMGFKAQLDSLMGKLPRQRRTGLFSATQTEAVEALARAGLRNPVRVAVAVTHKAASFVDDGDEAAENGKKKKKKTSSSAADASEGDIANANTQQQITPSTLSVQYRVVDTSEKLPQLAAFLAAHPTEKIIVYFLTCACVDYFATALPRLPACKKIAFHALHGRMKQAARETTLASFASATSGVLLATDVAARGLDIPDVHWVVQHDPPQDPSAFVHRCGRTARMGRSGSALAFLTPAELPYVDFLKLRKIPLTEENPEDLDSIGQGLNSALTFLRKESESDRAVMEAGTKAFVSYIRAYKEHHCKYIFRLEDVPLGHLAASFALLKLPRMPEAKKASRLASAGQLDGFVQSTIDPETVRFKDKTREKQRQAVLKQRAAKEAEEGITTKNQKRKAPNGAPAAAAAMAQQPRLTAAKRRQLEARQEFNELNDEYALLRKLKKGKITQREYDVAAGLSDDDNEGGGKKKKNATGGGQSNGKKDSSNGNDATAENGVGNNKSSLGTTTTTTTTTKASSVALPKIGGRNLVAEATMKKAKKKMRKERMRAAKAAGGGDNSKP
jgi:ATP-dependent RNA helicase DDX55/SPB4